MQEDKKAIRYIIVDDEEGAINDLRWELKDLKFPLQEVAVFSDPVEAVSRINETAFDLLFLDISMPVIDGFGLIERLEQIDFNIVFTTAYDQYAIKAFRHNAIDYLLKPVSENELCRVLEKHVANRLTRNMKEQLESFREIFEHTGDKLKIYVKDEYLYIPFADIIRLEAKSNYTTIYTIPQQYLVSYPLKEYEQQLPEEMFIKVHRSHIVNINAIKGIGNSISKYIVMNNDDKVPVSRSKYSTLKQSIETIR